MKKLLFALGLIFGAVPLVHASSNPALVYQVAVASATTVVVSASSSSATSIAVQVDTPTLPGRVVLEVQNLDTSLNLFCAPMSSVTKTTGRKIAAGNSWVLSFADQFKATSGGITANAVHIWCVNDGTAGTTSVAVTQAY